MSVGTGVGTGSGGDVPDEKHGRRGHGRRGRHVLSKAVRPARCRPHPLVPDPGERGVAWRDRWFRRFRRSDRGMTTSEYAMGTIAACAFAAVLYKVVNSGAVQDALQSLIKGALDGSF